MVLTLTALVELFGFFILSILAYRLYQTYKETRSLLSRLLFYFAGLFSLYFFSTGIGVLFFAENSSVLKALVVNAVFLESLGCAVAASLVMYFLLPKINPIWVFLFIFIFGIGLTIFTFKTPFSPYLESVGSIKTINWNSPSIIGFLQSIIFFITFVLLSSIFLFYSQISKTSFTKGRSLGMALVILLGLNAAFIDYFLEDFLKLNPLASDLAIGFFGIFLFTLLSYFSFQPGQSKDSEKKALSQI